MHLHVSDALFLVLNSRRRSQYSRRRVTGNFLLLAFLELVGLNELEYSTGQAAYYTIAFALAAFAARSSSDIAGCQSWQECGRHYFLTRQVFVPGSE